jgi:hypothetical protein
MDEDKGSQEARAKRLREGISNLKSGAAKSPREFVDKRAAELKRELESESSDEAKQ